METKFFHQTSELPTIVYRKNNLSSKTDVGSALIHPRTLGEAMEDEISRDSCHSEVKNVLTPVQTPKIVLTRMMTTNYLLENKSTSPSLKIADEEHMCDDFDLTDYFDSPAKPKTPPKNLTRNQTEANISLKGKLNITTSTTPKGEKSKSKKNYSLELPKKKTTKKKLSPASPSADEFSPITSPSKNSHPKHTLAPIPPKETLLEKHLKKCLKMANSWIKKDAKSYITAYRKEYNHKISKSWYQENLEIFKTFKFGSQDDSYKNTQDENEILFYAENASTPAVFVQHIVYDPIADAEHLMFFESTAGSCPQTLELSYKIHRILANIKQLEFAYETLRKLRIGSTSAQTHNLENQSDCLPPILSLNELHNKGSQEIQYQDSL